MEKQIVLTTGNGTAARVNNTLNTLTETAQRICTKASAPLQWLRGYYSTVLEQPVSMRQTKALTAAQLAFLVTVMPADYPLLMRLAACAWFVASILKCRRVMESPDHEREINDED